MTAWNRTRLVVDGLTTLVLLGTCAFLVWTAWPRLSKPSTVPIPKDIVSIANSPVTGSTAAPVGIIVYSDFECPFCGKFANETLPLLQKYFESGNVLLAFKHLPLSIHKSAVTAAVASDCAGSQQKFWQMHDATFRQQKALDIASLLGHASSLGIDSGWFTDCLADERRRSRIQNDVAEAASLGISATPTFLIGRVQSGVGVRVTSVLEGVRKSQDFTEILDKMLANTK